MNQDVKILILFPGTKVVFHPTADALPAAQMEKQRIVPGKTSDNFSQLFKAREQYYIVLSLLEYSVSLVVSYDT